MKKYLVITLLTFLYARAYSQSPDGYNITVSVTGLKDSALYLAYHYGEKQYLRDTVQLDSRGTCVFSGNESLPQGIYMVVLPGKKYFEMLISKDQVFSVSCAYPDFFNTLEFKGSEENSYFVQYQRKWIKMQQEASSISRRLQANKQNKDSLSYLSESQKKQEQEMKAYLRKVINDNQDNLLSALVKSILPVEVPEFIIPAGTHNADSVRWLLRYNFNKDHFFDNIDLEDERLLRTPILYGKLETFFKSIVIQSPDSINRQIDVLLDKCRDNHDVFQFICVYLFNHFRESEIMGHDAVIVKLADDVYLSGKADWVTKEFRDDLAKQVDLLRNNLIGMKAHDLVMDSYKGIFVSLYDIEKDFTILYFWEPNCGHCQEATPKLKEFYDKPRNYTLEVFAICTTAEKPAWTKYIEEKQLNWINGWDPERASHFDYYYNIQSTPMVYILDRNKKIIAKKLSVEDISGFIDNYRKFFN